MSSAKEDILARIRSSLADAPVAPEPVRNYRRVSELTEEQTINMLVDRLIDYKANVFFANPENISEVIAERLGEKSTYVVPEGLDKKWLPADTAVTGSTVSCAETGTIFLNTNPEEGRRAITLVPDHHICVVPRSTVVELVPESIERITYTRPVTMISGPSATSDIELIRVEGVHGPRTLDVIIYDAK